MAIEIEVGTSNPNQKSTFPKDGNHCELKLGPAMLRLRVQTQTKNKNDGSLCSVARS
jgi:hypothetical protein